MPCCCILQDFCKIFEKLDGQCSVHTFCFEAVNKKFVAKIILPGGVLISPSFWAPLITSTDHLRGMNQLDSNMSRESSSPILCASSERTIPVLTSSAILGNLKKVYVPTIQTFRCGARWKGFKFASEKIAWAPSILSLLQKNRAHLMMQLLWWHFLFYKITVYAVWPKVV